MLDAKIVQLKRSGKENSQHKPPIENDDLLKLKASGVFFSSTTYFLFCETYGFMWFSTFVEGDEKGSEI